MKGISGAPSAHCSALEDASAGRARVSWNHTMGVSDVHRERLRALGLAGYRLHDSRHHWAVRTVRAGMPLERWPVS